MLGDDAGQRAENLLSLLDGKGHPQPLRIRLTIYLAAARGGTTAVRDWRMTTLLAEYSAGAPGTTPPIGAALATR
jgi:hypothetical protein